LNTDAAARQPGKRVSLRDVAKAAGVAVSTVSRVLSDHPDVSGRTKQRVMAVVDELGYQPNALGQMLRQGSTRTVGFAIGDISNPLLAQIALGAETELRERGYSLLLSNSMNDPDQELSNLRTLEQRRVDGLLLSVTSETNPDIVTLLQRFDGPIVAIDRSISPAVPVGSVYSDHRTGITAAVDALHRAGHRRISLITGLSDLRPGRERIDAVIQETERLGMTCRVESRTDTAGPSISEIMASLTAPDRPSAVIAGNNQVIARVLEALNRAELRYPADISLVTCDEVSLQRFVTPRIATVRRDTHRLGQSAARLLLERLTDRDLPVREIELPTVFDEAASIGAPSAN